MFLNAKFEYGTNVNASLCHLKLCVAIYNRRTVKKQEHKMLVAGGKVTEQLSFLVSNISFDSEKVLLVKVSDFKPFC